MASNSFSHNEQYVSHLDKLSEKICLPGNVEFLVIRNVVKNESYGHNQIIANRDEREKSARVTINILNQNNSKKYISKISNPH